MLIGPINIGSYNSGPLSRKIECISLRERDADFPSSDSGFKTYLIEVLDLSELTDSTVSSELLDAELIEEKPKTQRLTKVIAANELKEVVL